ncbi:MAG: von Willebrand factor type A domain-containing protein [Segetibacter sp.]
MKLACLILLLCFIFPHLSIAQYSVRGEVTNEKGEKLAGVTLTIHSDKTIYKTTSSGNFEIPVNSITDTISFSSDGYEPLTMEVKATEFLKISLKMLPTKGSQKTNYLASVVKREKGVETAWTPANEDYSSIIENPFVKTKDLPAASFSANINRASYSNVRRFLNMNERVPPDAVRIEEMLNYFNFNYTEPPKNKVFQSSSYITACPWNKEHKILLLNICARKINLQNLPAGNFVFLIDVSGSMDMPNKLALLKSGFRSLVQNLRQIDTISIVTYGEEIEIALNGTSGAEKNKIIAAIEALKAEGSTPGEAGLKLAYKVAKKQFIAGGNNRIILATDGDFNVGLTAEKDLQDLVEQQYQTGIYLTCLGVGMGNYKDAKLSILAQKAGETLPTLTMKMKRKRYW